MCSPPGPAFPSGGKKPRAVRCPPEFAVEVAVGKYEVSVLDETYSEEGGAEALALRVKVRAERSRLIVTEIREWAFERRMLPESYVGKAGGNMLAGGTA